MVEKYGNVRCPKCNEDSLKLVTIRKVVDLKHYSTQPLIKEAEGPVEQFAQVYKCIKCGRHVDSL